MKLFLLREKPLNLKQFAPEIMFQVPTASRVASFLGLCQSTMTVILETPLHIRAIQKDLIKAIAPLGLHASYKINSPSRAACKDKMGCLPKFSPYEDV